MQRIDDDFFVLWEALAVPRAHITSEIGARLLRRFDDGRGDDLEGSSTLEEFVGLVGGGGLQLKS